MNQSESRAETRFEAILPTLATKSDVAEVRVEIANVRAEMSKQYADHTKWLMGLFVMMVIGFGGIAVGLMRSPPQQGQQMPSLSQPQRDTAH